MSSLLENIVVGSLTPKRKSSAGSLTPRRKSSVGLGTRTRTVGGNSENEE